MSGHSLILEDRGGEHIHRWAPSCSCGKWAGVFRRRKREAVAQYRDHAEITDHQKRRKDRGEEIQPRELSPLEDWPEEWRASAI